MTRPLIAPDLPDLLLLSDLLATAAKVLITTHHRPDGDAIGSVLGLARILRAAGYAVTAHTPDPPPAFFDFLPDRATLTHATPPRETFDLAFALDHSTLPRTGLAGFLRAARLPVVGIDHHGTNDFSATANLVVPEAAATCEILAALADLLNLPVDAPTATCLLTGLVTDTGSFQHPNTSAHVLATVSALLSRGADLRAILTHTHGSRALPSLRIIGRALERTEVNPTTGVAVSVITHRDLADCGATVDDLQGVANLLNTVPEVSYSLLLTEPAAGTLKGSLRGKPSRAVDVSVIARRFGGGGHPLAAGFELKGSLARNAHGWLLTEAS